MAPILSYRDLDVWQLGMTLTVEVYRITDKFPSGERFGLVSQMRRAAVSIPSNVAEGHARGEGAYINHLRIALGSQAELSTEIEAALRLGLVSPDAAGGLESRITEIRRMLHGLRASLERRRKAKVSGCLLVFLATLSWLV
jgi:four helix bundle protein